MRQGVEQSLPGGPVLEREALERARLEDEELALLARAVGDHLPIEDRMRLEAVCRHRRARTG